MKTRLHSERGIALLFVLMSGGLLLTMALGLASMIRTDMEIGHAQATLSRSFYAAEAGVNRSVGEFLNIFLDSRVPTASDLTARTFSLNDETIRYQLSESPSNPTSETIPLGQRFAGLNTILYEYVSTSEALATDGNPNITLGVHFEVHNIPLFQFAAFYEQDLEIAPGPSMTLHGRVHTNGDLYIDNGSSTTTALRIEDDPTAGINTVQVTAAGNILRGRKDQSECNGTLWVDEIADADASGDLDPLELPCGGTVTRQVPSAELDAWDGSMKDQVETIVVPSPGFIARGTGTYWTNADLRIVLNLNETMRLFGAAGPLLYKVEVHTAAGAEDAAATAQLHLYMKTNSGKIFYNAMPACDETNPKECALDPTKYSPAFALADLVYRQASGATAADPDWHTATGKMDYRRGGFYNNREQKWITMLNIDVEHFLAWNMAQAPSDQLIDPDDDTNGGIVLFLSVAGSDSDLVNNYGVRVFDSADLPFNTTASADPTGLTIVSDQAVYVQGDYNSINKDPAAFLADSVNVLSSGWEDYQNDYKSRQTLADRKAHDTTINAAFLGGVDETTAGGGYGAYNGGWENYPRFHEDWSPSGFPQATLAYQGSFISLGLPQHVNGAWCGTGGSSAWSGTEIVVNGCNIYDPPVRAWDFDADFENVANLPPADPRFIYTRQILFSQEFR